MPLTPRPPRPARSLLAVLGLALLLGACSKPAPPPPPELGLETAPAGWWVTTPEVALSDHGSLSMTLSFKNTSASSMRFEGAAHPEGPAGGLQVWTTPGISVPPVTFRAYPEGDYPSGAVMAWEVTIDLSSLPATERGLAVRPVESNLFGTLGPDSVELVAAVGTLAR